ncbi:MAG TPA: hypothetical protein ENF68_00530 [bacterium]|nr:hypothetical protein [bacterium]
MLKILQKIFGWLLLFTGLAIISWTLYSSYNIFYKNQPLPCLFRVQEERAPAPPSQRLGLEAQLEEKMKEAMTEQIKEIIPPGTIEKLLNIIAWSVFAGILIFGASQISSLGIKMIL